MRNTSQQLKDFTYSAMFSALTIALGFVSIPLPISPVPISGLSLGVMLAGSVLTARQAIYSILTVILLGAVGLPVYSGFTGGLGVLFGPRGGYYFGFMLGAAAIAWLRGSSLFMPRLLAANIFGGIIIVYAFAVPWLAFVTGMDLQQAVAAGVFPFLIGDCLKAATASMLAVVLSKHITVFRGENV